MKKHGGISEIIKLGKPPGFVGKASDPSHAADGIEAYCKDLESKGDREWEKKLGPKFNKKVMSKTIEKLKRWKFEGK